MESNVEAETDINTKTPPSLKCNKTQYFFDDLVVWGVRCGKQNRSKHGTNVEVRILIDVASIFGQFWVHV